MKPKTTETEWRCRKCGTLLGVHRTGQIHIKHKRAQLMVRGEVLAVCPRCAELNQIASSPSAEPPRPAV